MPAGKHPRSNFILLIMALSVMLEVCRVHGCRTGSGSECDNDNVVPGSNLAGQGFDVVRMRRTGAYVINVKAYLADNHTCTLCPNPFQNGQIQKLPAAVLDWRTHSSCNQQLSSAMHHSVDSMLRSSSSQVNKNWYLGLSHDQVGTAVLGGSTSTLAEFTLSQHSVDKSTFAIHEISCTYYSYRMADHPQLSTEFTKHLNRLPKSLSTSQDRAKYRHLIDTYGTHYIHKVQLGGKLKQMTAFRTCLAKLNGYSESEINNCLSLKFRVALGFLPGDAYISQECKNFLKGTMSIGSSEGFMTQKTEVIGGEQYHPYILYQQVPSEAYRNWMNSLRQSPDVVSYEIFPLHHLVEDSQISDNLKSIVTDYIKENQPGGHSAYKRCYTTYNLDRNCCPLRLGRGTLELKIKRAEGLYADPFSKADALVKIFFDGHYRETAMILDDDNPEWNEWFYFGSVKVGQRMRFEVWDEDMYEDDLLGSCRLDPESGTHFMRCELSTGAFFFTYTVRCDAHLTGGTCGSYSPNA